MSASRDHFPGNKLGPDPNKQYEQVGLHPMSDPILARLQADNAALRKQVVALRQSYEEVQRNLDATREQMANNVAGAEQQVKDLTAERDEQVKVAFEYEQAWRKATNERDAALAGQRKAEGLCRRLALAERKYQGDHMHLRWQEAVVVVCREAAEVYPALAEVAGEEGETR